MQVNNPIPPVLPVYNAIEAYTNLKSVTQGQSINFHVWIQGIDPSNPAPFNIDIYRIEENDIYVTALNGTSYEQPTNSEPSINGCGWQSSLEWNVPSDLKSGAYRAYLSTQLTDSLATTYLVFFVKSANPGVNANILFVGSVTTWEAYNL